MIFNLPAILGLLPLILYIIFMLIGMDMNVAVLISVVLVTCPPILVLVRELVEI
jgi:hypothetical protein